MTTEMLSARLTECGIPHDAALPGKLLRYHELLLDWNTRMDLTAVTEEAEMIDKHYVDSLIALKTPGLIPQSGRLIDVGTGAGFPGLPLALACPQLQVTLLDSLGKRMRWLETVLPQLGVANAHCVTARAEEEVTKCRETYDYATSRAVARLNVLLELTAPYVRVGGKVLAMKGSAAREELEESRNAIKRLGLKLEEVKEFQIDGASHSVIVLKKVAPTPPQYPRRYAKIKQSPL